MKDRSTLVRWLRYAVGMTLLAVGLTLTAQSGLGTSPLTSVAFVLGECLSLRFSDATLIMFTVFVAAQIALESKRTPGKLVRLLLQLPLSLAFTRVMGLVQRWTDLSGASLSARVAVLLLAIVLTGVGAAMTLRADLVPNPGDGIVKALATRLGKPLGAVKNAFDIANVAAAAGLSWTLLGRIVGVGVGSVLCMLGVGRVIALYNRLTAKQRR